MTSWVRRVASVSWICENCDDWIECGDLYYRMLTGEKFCWLCPPDEAETCSL